MKTVTFQDFEMEMNASTTEADIRAYVEAAYAYEFDAEDNIEKAIAGLVAAHNDAFPFDAPALTERAIQLVHAQHTALSRALGVQPIPRPVESSIASQIALLCDAANGVLDFDADYDRVKDTWDSLVNTLYSSPMTDEDSMDAETSAQPLGQLLVAVLLWLTQDELISYSDAALLLRGEKNDTTLRYINDLVSRGKITRYIDPNETNPQRSGRVRRSEVEAFKSNK